MMDVLRQCVPTVFVGLVLLVALWDRKKRR